MSAPSGEHSLGPAHGLTVKPGISIRIREGEVPLAPMMVLQGTDLDAKLLKTGMLFICVFYQHRDMHTASSACRRRAVVLRMNHQIAVAESETCDIPFLGAKLP